MSGIAGIQASKKMQKNTGSASAYTLQGPDGSSKPTAALQKSTDDLKYDTRQVIPEEVDEEPGFKAENLRVRLFKEESASQNDLSEIQSHASGKHHDNPQRKMLKQGKSERDSYLPVISFSIVFQDGSEAELQVADYDEDPVFEVMRFAIKYKIADLALVELLRRRVVREIMRKKGMYKATPSNHHNPGSKTGGVASVLGSNKPQNLSFNTRRASEGIGLNTQIGLSQTSKNLKKITEVISKPLHVETLSSGLHSSQVSGSNSNLIPKIQTHSSAAKASQPNLQTVRRPQVSSSQNGLNNFLNPHGASYHNVIPPPNSKTKLGFGQGERSHDSRSFLQASISRERDYSQSAGVPTQSPIETPTEQRRAALQGSSSQVGRARQAPSNSIDTSKPKTDFLYHTSGREVRPETVTHNLYKQPSQGTLYRQNSDSSQHPALHATPAPQTQHTGIPEVSYTLSKLGAAQHKQQQRVASGTGSSTTPPPGKQPALPTPPLSSVRLLGQEQTHDWLFGLLDGDRDGWVGPRDIDLERLTDATSADVFEALQVVLEAVFERQLLLDREGWKRLMRDLAETGVWD